MAENDKKELKYNLPGNHVDITDKKETIDLLKILNEDCELILFELPKNFDKQKLKDLNLRPIMNAKKEYKNTKFIDDYNCLCYSEHHPTTKQTLTVLNNKKKKSLIFKPIHKYIKVYEAISLFEPKEDAIIKRKLRAKNKNK